MIAMFDGSTIGTTLTLRCSSIHSVEPGVTGTVDRVAARGPKVELVPQHAASERRSVDDLVLCKWSRAIRVFSVALVRPR